MASPIAPVVNSATYDKASYVAGDLMTVTVSYSPGQSSNTQSSTYQATDLATNLSGQLVVSFTVFTKDATTWTVTDSKARKYTLVSDDGVSKAVFTATA